MKLDLKEITVGFVEWLANQPEIEYMGMGKWYDGFQDGEFTTLHYWEAYMSEKGYKKLSLIENKP